MYIFFFNDTATTEIYTLSLHDALPISSGADRLARMLRDRGILSARVPDLPPGVRSPQRTVRRRGGQGWPQRHSKPLVDRKSTRLNFSHANISYAVFCLKKKKILTTPHV